MTDAAKTKVRAYSGGLGAVEPGSDVEIAVASVNLHAFDKDGTSFAMKSLAGA